MSQDRNRALLNEMGITEWKLQHPERLTGYTPKPFNLKSDVKLLFVSEFSPKGNCTQFMQKVVQGAIKLNLESCRHITPAHFAELSEHALEWVWFCGCEAQPTEVSKIITSPLLSEIDGHNQNRRDLWQQIKSYE